MKDECWKLLSGENVYSAYMVACSGPLRDAAPPKYLEHTHGIELGHHVIDTPVELWTFQKVRFEIMD